MGLIPSKHGQVGIYKQGYGKWMEITGKASRVRRGKLTSQDTCQKQYKVFSYQCKGSRFSSDIKSDQTLHQRVSLR